MSDGDGTGGVVGIQLMVDMADVGVYGGVADAELIGDFLFDHAIGEQLQDFVFTFGEFLHILRFRGRGLFDSQPLHKIAGDAWIQ